MFETISPITIWLIVGILFIVFEMFIPGLIIGFFGLGAILTCLTTWLKITESFPSQMLVFLSTSLAFLFLFHRVLKKLKKPVQKGETTDFNIQIGKIVPVTEFINPDEGGGKVRYQGALWSASSTDKIAPGETAKVIGCENLTLIVEATGKKGE